METFKTIISFIFGNSKTPLIVLTVLFLLVGGYLFYIMNNLQEKLRVEQLNNEIMKTNIEKIEKAKLEQDKTIQTYKQLIEFSNQTYQETIVLLQKQTLENQKLIKKLLQINYKNFQKDPISFQQKINETMIVINNCYEKLSEIDLRGTKKDEPKECNSDYLPEFSN